MDFGQFKNTAATNPVPVEAPVKEKPQGEWGDDEITYVVVTQDRLGHNQRNFPIILPHVDRAVVVDGYSKDGTYEYLKSLGPKVEVYQREWDDSFANQYNEYLKHLKGGWVLLCDDDEVPSEEMLLSLRELVKRSNGGAEFGVVEFRSNDISYVEGDWENRVDNGPCDYFRQIFFKWHPDMHYTVHLHQALQGMRGPVVRCNAHYYHIKSTKDELRNSCRNYFISGEWPSYPVEEGIKTTEWNEMKAILAEHHPEVKIFSQLNGLLVSGQVCQEFKDWANGYAHHNEGVEGESSGELRAFARYLELLS
jgi:glycosyltransferase involved in cell wall biosynthesis